MISYEKFATQIRDSSRGPRIVGELSLDLLEMMAQKMQINSWVVEQPSNLQFKNFKVDSWTIINESVERKFDEPSKEVTKYDFPSNVRAFAAELGIVARLEEISRAIFSIKQFLEQHDLDADIQVDLSSDDEYPEWKNIEIRIAIKKDLKYIYDDIKPKIYTLTNSLLSEDLLDKILISFDTLN